MSELKVMRISAINDLPQRLCFMAKGLQSEYQADNEQLYIECYRKEDENVIRLSTSTGIWTEVNPYDKEEGDILPFSVSVNLYDFFNAVDHCIDELISLWIDEETNELVLNSFYNPDKELDELEVRFKIGTSKFPFRPITVTPDAKLINTIELDAQSLVEIMTQLNYEKTADGVNIIVENKKLKFQNVYAGMKSTLILKTYEQNDYDTDCSVYIPFNIFGLMLSTGQHTPLIFNIYENNTVTLTACEYNFMHVDTTNTEIFTLDVSKFNDYFVMDAKLLECNMKLLNKLTQQVPIVNVKFEKVDACVADIICEYPNRYTVAMRTDLAMLSDKEMNIDARILSEMIRHTNVDAIRVKIDDFDGVYIGYENAIVKKQTVYDHSEFSKYRVYKESL